MARNAPAASSANLLLCLFWISLSLVSGSARLCIEKERKALLDVRTGLSVADGRLSPWRGDDCCKWERVECHNITSHVVKLDLSNLGGSTPNKSEVSSSLLDLEHLTYLDLSSNNFGGTPIPAFLGSLTQLEHLDLSQGGFSGRIPHQLGNLSKLVRLDLNDNSIEGEIPETIVHLRNLQFLYLSYNSISGQIPESIGNLQQLKELSMSDNNISGSIPSSLGGLCNLNKIDLGDNRITGELAEFFDQLSRCRNDMSLSLVLQKNDISGPLPIHMEKLQRLFELDLGSNSLNGSIPTSLGKLSQLTFLDLSSNYLIGGLTEAHFFNLTSLLRMDLSHNNLSVDVSSDWLPPFQAREIAMGSCNLGPRFPPWLKNQIRLHSLDISNNRISDSFPEWLWSVYNRLMDLNVSHNHMNGTLCLECFKDFIVFDLSYNNLGGLIPRMLHVIVHLDFSHNSFSGPIPESLVGEGDGLGSMFLSDNRLNGSIPSSICTANLLIVNLANNDLSGALPDCWSNSTDLRIMDVSSNKLSGGIPTTIGLLTKLQSLHLNNNSFTGSIPSTLQQCRELVVIDLSLNKLSDGIPSWIGGSLLSLQVLSLRSNKLSGEIPLQLSLVPSIQVLDLAHNNLSGSLPPGFGNFSSMATSQNGKELTRLSWSSLYYTGSVTITTKDLQLSFTTTLSLVTSIDLSNNNLFGEIPKELTNLHGLHFFNLSWNHLSGNIPDEIGLMGQLESLDLSKNHLSGEIPLSISALNFLSVLNLSYNNFIGRIPTGKQLQTFTNLSYIDNPKLCGEPLQTNCPSDNPIIDVVAEEEDMHEDDEYGGIWYFIGFTPGFVFGFWGFMGVVMIKRTTRIKYILLIDMICNWFVHM